MQHDEGTAERRRAERVAAEAGTFAAQAAKAADDLRRAADAANRSGALAAFNAAHRRYEELRTQMPTKPTGSQPAPSITWVETEAHPEEMPPSVREWFARRSAATRSGPPQGSAEHAAALGEGRHPGVRDALQWLTYAHLPEALQRFSAPFYEAAARLVATIATDSPELTTALNRLIEAKDSAVRAGIRHDTGRAGSVPRPQQVVQPPVFAKPNLPPNLVGHYPPDQPQPRSAIGEKQPMPPVADTPTPED